MIRTQLHCLGNAHEGCGFGDFGAFFPSFSLASKWRAGAIGIGSYRKHLHHRQRLIGWVFACLTDCGCVCVYYVIKATMLFVSTGSIASKRFGWSVCMYVRM